MSATLDEQVAMVADVAGFDAIDADDAVDLLAEHTGVDGAECARLLLEECQRRKVRARRAELLSLAHCCLNDQITDTVAAIALRALAPHLGEERRWQMFEELLDAVALVDSVLLGFTHWCEVVPDATGVDRDGQAEEQARVRVDLALDELVGGE